MMNKHATATDLDTATLQSIYISQETRDRVQAGDLGLTAGHWDAEGLRMTNLADGTVATDSATKGQVDAIAGSATDAAASAAAAAVSATNASADASLAQSANVAAQSAKLGAESARDDITGSIPTTGLNSGRTLVASSSTTYAETRTRTLEQEQFLTFSGTSFAVNLTSKYAEFQIELFDWIPADNDKALFMEVKDAGSFITTGYESRGNEAHGSGAGRYTPGASEFQLSSRGVSNVAGDGLSAAFTLRSGSVGTVFIFGQGGFSDGSNLVQFSYAGRNTAASSQLTQIRFTVEDGGSHGGGFLRVWGII